MDANAQIHQDKNTVYYYLAILNLLSGAAVLFVGFSLFSVVGVVFIALLTAWLEAAVFGWLRKTFLKPLAVPLLSAVALVMNILIVVDAFLLLQFDTIISLQTIDLILGTNMSEAREFLSSYVTFPVLTVALLALGALNAGVWYLARYLARKTGGNRIVLWSKRVSAAIGAVIMAYMVVMFAIYRHGAQVPTFSAPMRVAYAMVQHVQNGKMLVGLRNLCLETTVEKSDAPAFDIVWVLGESFSRSHSPLYGYDKDTNPRLADLAADSSLVVMTDVVTHEDWTQKVLKSLCSTGKGNGTFGTKPLFPVMMRKAGWNISLYDNEFLETPGTSFFYDDPTVSAMMFDSRNSKKTALDGDLVRTAVLRDSASMYIFHLMGQHFAYADRYPVQYRRFTADDYDARRFNPGQREIMAHYDNAPLYNDAVVGDIVGRFRDRDCIVIYFPDHGEEIYDCRDYFGHGNAITAPDVSYQIRIPMFIYFSDSFKASHPDIVTRIKNARSLPVTTDDFAHFMLDLSGVRSEHFDPSRSFMNEAYDSTAPRIVLHSFDFNAVNDRK